MTAPASYRGPPAPDFLFDLDGTLIDSVYQHVAWHAALSRLDIDLSVWRIPRRIGTSGGMLVSACRGDRQDAVRGRHRQAAAGARGGIPRQADSVRLAWRPCGWGRRGRIRMGAAWVNESAPPGSNPGGARFGTEGIGFRIRFDVGAGIARGGAVCGGLAGGAGEGEVVVLDDGGFCGRRVAFGDDGQFAGDGELGVHDLVPAGRVHGGRVGQAVPG